jgi:uroporphyrinogen decarboxylase
MAKAEMTGKERILAAIRHEEPDRVPISPRYAAWFLSEYGRRSLEEHLALLPYHDFMHVVGEGTRNYLDIYPETYDLPGVEVEQSRYEEGNLTVVERTFHTPAGDISDRTKIAPSGREYGVSPNPIKTEHLVKGPEDLEALKHTLCPINTNFDHVREAQRTIGDRGVVMVCVRSALDHNAGYARDMQDLMMDAYDNRAFLSELMRIYQERSLEMIKAALESGAKFIFGSWYFNSLSSGWSPSLFEELFVPQIREHVELTHSYGAFYDYYDDGKLADTMEMIADAGVDVLETCTPPPVGDFDLAEAKARIGSKTTIKGYVDLLYVIKHGTPDMVDDTVKQAMSVGKAGGGFILGSSDSFREGTPPGNLEAYWRACKRYGVYD